MARREHRDQGGLRHRSRSERRCRESIRRLAVRTGRPLVRPLHPHEIDDGVPAIGPPYAANLARFVNGERIDGEDVVVWYGAHFTHDIGAQPPGHFGHIVGPTLKPVNWT